MSGLYFADQCSGCNIGTMCSALQSSTESVECRGGAVGCREKDITGVDSDRWVRCALTCYLGPVIDTEII